MNVITHPAARSALYASPEGELLVPGTRAFCERIGYQNPDFDAGDYAVRNMGFVAIARNAPGRLKLRLRPGLVSGHALKAVCRFVSERNVPEIEVEHFDDTWKSELLTNTRSVLQHLAELCAKPPPSDRQAWPNARFTAKPIALTKAADEFGNPLKPLLQKWRVSSGTFDDTTLPFLMRYGLSLKLTILAAKKKGDPLRFRFISDELKIFSAMERLALIGQPIESQPDKAYGAWLQDLYRTVVDDHQPRHDVVNATVGQDTDDARRIVYERLVLPWRSTTGILVTTCSVVLSTESIRTASDNIRYLRKPVRQL